MTNLSQRDMWSYVLTVTSCLCLLLTGVLAEDCSLAVKGRRATFNVLAGDHLSLSCVVHHCGDNWTGKWLWRNATDYQLRDVNKNHSCVQMSANKTKLVLEFQRVTKLNEGDYACSIRGSRGESEQGHLITVNVTAAVPRTILHRAAICASALVLSLIILVLARCLSSRVKPQPLPRTMPTYAVVSRNQPHPAPRAPRAPRAPQAPLVPQAPPRCLVPQKYSTPTRKAHPKSPQKTEVVYADISQDSLRQQGAIASRDQGTVYSDLRFS